MTALDRAQQEFRVAAKALASFKQHLQYARGSLEVVKGFGIKLFGEIPEEVVEECRSVVMSALCAAPPDPERAVGSIREMAKELANSLGADAAVGFCAVFKEACNSLGLDVAKEDRSSIAVMMSRLGARRLAQILRIGCRLLLLCVASLGYCLEISPLHTLSPWFCSRPGASKCSQQWRLDRSCLLTIPRTGLCQ